MGYEVKKMKCLAKEVDGLAYEYFTLVAYPGFCHWKYIKSSKSRLLDSLNMSCCIMYFHSYISPYIPQIYPGSFGPIADCLSGMRRSLSEGLGSMCLYSLKLYILCSDYCSAPHLPYLRYESYRCHRLIFESSKNTPVALGAFARLEPVLGPSRALSRAD